MIRSVIAVALAGLVSLLPLSALAQGSDRIMVFAAASLTDALQEIGAAYGRERGKRVVFSFAASMTLARALVLCPLVALLAASCASVNFQRDSLTSGTFVSTGWSFTFFSRDVPESALNIARENASDARQPNMVVDETIVVPYLGPLDFLLDIISVRYARISGTWGFRPADTATP